MKNNLNNIFAILLSLLLMVVGLSNCEIQENFDYDPHNTSGELGITAWGFIQEQDSLSLLEEAITAAGMESYYSGTTKYTFIIPQNKAFRDYLTTNAYSSISDIPVPILKNILLYHIAEGKVLFTDEAFYTADATVTSQTENGQEIYFSSGSNYKGTINEGTNQSWTIQTSNLEPTNGAIHILTDIVYYSAATGGTTDVPTLIEADTIYATQDAKVRGGAYSSTNYGDAEDLLLRITDGISIDNRKFFLMFDLNDVTTGEPISGAYLVLGGYYWSAANGTDMNMRNVPDVTWEESTITWDNMPTSDAEIISSTPTGPVTPAPILYTWDCVDYISSKLESPGEISILVDGDLGSNDGIYFASKENTTVSSPPMIIVAFSLTPSTLAMGTNTGLTVANGGLDVLGTDRLSMDGADPSDIIYTLESAPSNGWLVAGMTTLSDGYKFTQLDIDANNIVYIHSGNGSADSFTVSVKDRNGGSIAPFDVNITIN